MPPRPPDLARLSAGDQGRRRPRAERRIRCARAEVGPGAPAARFLARAHPGENERFVDLVRAGELAESDAVARRLGAMEEHVASPACLAAMSVRNIA